MHRATVAGDMVFRILTLMLDAEVDAPELRPIENKYLVDTNRTVVVTMPKAKAKTATGASGQ